MFVNFPLPQASTAKSSLSHCYFADLLGKVEKLNHRRDKKGQWGSVFLVSPHFDLFNIVCQAYNLNLLMALVRFADKRDVSSNKLHNFYSKLL